MALPSAWVLAATAASACLVLAELGPVCTAVCTANPVRSTCSRNSVSRSARSEAAFVMLASELPPALIELMELDELFMLLDWPLAAFPPEPPQAVTAMLRAASPPAARKAVVRLDTSPPRWGG